MAVLRLSVLLLLALGLAMPASAQTLQILSDPPRVLPLAHTAALSQQRVELLADPSFEGGTPNTAWAEKGTSGLPLCTTGNCGNQGVPRTGDWFAWFGGFMEKDTMSVTQTFTTSADQMVTLSLHVKIGVATAPASLVLILDGQEIPFATDADAAAFSDYVLVGLSDGSGMLTPFQLAAGEHTLEIKGTIDGTATTTTSFFVDDVSIDAVGGGTNEREDYAATDTPLNIPDATASGVTSTLVVPAGGAPAEFVAISLGITHPYVGDLRATLSKGGLMSTLMNQPDNGVNTCSGNNLRVAILDGQYIEGGARPLDDNCVNESASSTEAYDSEGNYSPTTPLSVFAGAPADGTWTLTVSDNGFDDAGTLDFWTLSVFPMQGTAAESGAGATASRLAVAPNPIASSAQVDLTVGTAQSVRVGLYDLLGREVKVLHDAPVVAGQQTYIRFETAGLAPGVYVVRASGPGLNLAERVTVLR